ncbi:MAG: adenylate/guanylate cyclase domain-containing protein [Paracoccaceae bacterium]
MSDGGRRRAALGLILCALLATFVLAGARLMLRDPVSEAIESRLLDLRFRLRGPWPPIEDIVIVAVDEAAANAFSGPAALRAAIAKALPGMLEGGARAVAVDLLFVDPSPADGALGRALSASGRLVTAFAAVNEVKGFSSLAPETEAALDRSEFPIVVGRSAASAPSGYVLPVVGIAGAALLGHVNIRRSRDRIAREIPLAIPGPEGRLLPALPLLAVAVAEGKELRLFTGAKVEIGARSIAVDRAETIIIDHVGGRGAIPTFGLLDALEGRAPADAFRNRIVFIGATAESYRDTYATPFGADIAGVELLANVAAGLLHDRTIGRDAGAAAASVALALLLCAAVAGAALPASPIVATVFSGVMALFGLAVLQVAFAAAGVWLDAVMTIGGLVFGAAAAAAGRMAASRRESEVMCVERANLSSFVAPALVDRIARDGAKGFGRQRQMAAALFVDLVGFTRLAENASGEALTDFVAALHQYFETISASHEGVVVDFQGDGALIVFGLPEPRDGDATRALRCAEAFVSGSGAPAPPSDMPIRLRASVHYGPVVAAVLGGRSQSVVSLAGDTVNIAARLQDAAREARCRLVTTRETLDAAGGVADRGYILMGRQVIRGRSSETEIWRWAGPVETAQS